MCSGGKFLNILTPFLIFKLPGKLLCVLQNYLAPGNLTNLSFLAGAEQLNFRTPPLAASDFLINSYRYFL